MSDFDAVFFISFGGPEKSEDVMPFLELVTKGRGIPRERLLGVAEHYEHFGGRSPINEITARQAQGLAAALRASGDARPVHVGQRNWHPFIEDALRRMKDAGVKKAFGLCTAAYRCEASHERYVEAVEQARANLGPGAPVVEYAGPWFDHPLFIDAIAARVREKNVPADAPWTFTAHSIPCAMAKDSRYVEELKTAAGLVAAKFGKTDWTLAFTSRSGSPRDAWLEPDVSKVIRAAAADGKRDMVVIPIGFLADHVEVLYDLDFEARATADEVGLRLHRVETVGDHPAFIALLADLVRRGAPADTAGAASSKRRGDAPPPCYCFPGDPEPPCRRPPAARPTARPSGPPSK
jgi:ferrochelatase